MNATDPSGKEQITVVVRTKKPGPNNDYTLSLVVKSHQDKDQKLIYSDHSADGLLANQKGTVAFSSSLLTALATKIPAVAVGAQLNTEAKGDAIKIEVANPEKFVSADGKHEGFSLTQKYSVSTKVEFKFNVTDALTQLAKKITNNKDNAADLKTLQDYLNANPDSFVMSNDGKEGGSIQVVQTANEFQVHVVSGVNGEWHSGVLGAFSAKAPVVRNAHVRVTKKLEMTGPPAERILDFAEAVTGYGQYVTINALEGNFFKAEK
jgi:hypothetical protein